MRYHYNTPWQGQNIKKRSKTPQKTIRQIRTEYAKLKRAGVVPKLDARKIQATPTVLKQLKKFEKIISGEYVAIKVKPTQNKKSFLDDLRASGYKIAKPKGLEKRILVPAPPKKTIINDGKVEEIKTRKVKIPKKQTLIQFLESKRGEKIPNNERLAFKLFGNGSRAVYDSYEDAVNDLLKYEAVLDSRKDPGSQLEIAANLEFITFTNTKKNKLAYVEFKRARRSELKQQKAEKRKMARQLNPPITKKRFLSESQKEANRKRAREYKRAKNK